MNIRKIRKILLINPPFSYKKQLGFLSKNSPKVPPMGLLSIGSYMKHKGYDVKIIDAQVFNTDIESLLKEIGSYCPQLIGITSVTSSISDAAVLSKAVKKAYQNIITVIGGVHVSALPEKTLRRFPVFDYAVIGEGEMTLFELVEALNNGANVDTVPGIACLSGNEYYFTGVRGFIENINDLPPEDWGLIEGLNTVYHPALPLIKKLPSATMITGRGCIGRCIFCSTNFLEGKKLRLFSAERVISNIDVLYNKYGIRDISFYDVNFMVKKERFFEITTAIKSKFPLLTWSGYSRIDCIDEEMIKHAKETGCCHISYGIESGNDRVLKFIKKGITIDQVRKVIDMTKAHKITTRGLFMFGHPTETIESMKDTLRLILGLDLDDFHSTLFTPLPGTDIYNNASNYGKWQEDWDKMNIFNCLFIPSGLDKKTLEKYQKRAYRSFYLRPGTILNKLKNLSNNKYALKILFYGGLSLLHLMFLKNND